MSESPHEGLGHSFDEVDSEEPLTKLPTTLNHLLTSNVPPTTLQVTQISSVELKLLSDFLDVKDQIEEHEDILSDLRARQREQRRLLKKCKFLRSLIRSLPDELLSQIFMECIPEGGVTVCLETSLGEAPMLLCHVCSKWRSVAFSTPQLWNRLRATIGPKLPPHPTYSRNLITLVQEWFDRAKSLPLSLRFASHLAYFAQYFAEETVDDPKVPYNLIHALSGRLSFLDLAMGWTPHYLRLLCYQVEEPFPILESLILRGTIFAQHETCFSRRGKPITAFQDARKLKRVAMYYPIFADDIGNVLFPWEQLTHFIISEKVTHGVMEDLLRSCTYLQQGVFNLSTTPQPIPSRAVKSVHHHLVDLTITTTLDESFNTSILRNFELPALWSLRLGPLIVSDEQWEQRDLLYPHLSAIRRLSFLGGYKTSKTLVSERIVELLRCAENVERLELCPGIWYPGLLEALTIVAPASTSPTAPAPAQIPSPSVQKSANPSPCTPILPKLRTLSIDLGVKPTGIHALWELVELEDGLRRNPRRFSSQALKGMVESRWMPFGGGRHFEEGGQRCEGEAGGVHEEKLRVESGEEFRVKEPRVACLEKLQIYLTKEDGPISDEIQDVLGEYMDEGLIVEERCLDTLGHWSTRLKDELEEVSWPEGLSVLVSEYSC